MKQKPTSLGHERLIFISGNPGKVREFNAVLKDVVPRLVQQDLHLPQLQGSPEEISRQKIKLAIRQVQSPCVVEDTCVCFNALNGLPGPYIKTFIKKIGLDGIIKILSPFKDKSASVVWYSILTYYYSTIGFCEDEGKEPVLFQGKCSGIIVPKRGPEKFGFDPIFQPDGYKKTFAEMSFAEKTKISARTKALEHLADFLTKHPVLGTG